MFAARYGYTVDEFADLTPRQVFRLGSIINRARIAEIFEGSLSYKIAHMKKPPSPESLLGSSSGESEFTPETDAKLDEYAERLVARQREEALNVDRPANQT